VVVVTVELHNRVVFLEVVFTLAFSVACLMLLFLQMIGIALTGIEG